VVAAVDPVPVPAGVTGGLLLALAAGGLVLAAGRAWVWCPGPVAAAVFDCGELLTVEELLNRQLTTLHTHAQQDQSRVRLTQRVSSHRR